MCGIVYKSNFYTPTRYADFIDACDKLNHRGPDEFGYLFTKDHSLGHKRLSIIDIENGKQPMSILNHHLIYNGELYNIDELQELLKKKNVELENHSDTLLLLKMLMTYGTKALEHLNGIFSFVYTDKDKVIAVRDMFGVKPLYYTLIDNDLFVASEIKSILAYKKEAVVNTEGLCELLGMGPSHSQGKTVYKDIYEVKPGNMLVFDKKNGLRVEQYYRLKVYPFDLTYEETVQRVRALLDRAIQRQMISDVGISCFLSGGLDSSIISTIASKHTDRLDTFSIDYEDNIKDFVPNSFEITPDRVFAEKVSEAIGSKHHKVVIDNDTLVSYLQKAVDLKDSPGMTDIDGSMIYLAQNIARYYKVSLSGEAADEVFAGYPWYYKKEKESNTFPWIRNIKYKESLLNEEYRNKLRLEEYIQKEYEMACEEAPVLPGDTKTDRKHRRLCYLNIKYFMTNLLDRKDRMTMGASLEVRVPFCDKDLVEFLYNVPYKYKYRNKTEKKLLRDAYKDTVIPDVVNRKKSPYPKSNSKKYHEMVKKLLYKALEDKSSVLYKIFDIDKIKEVMESSDELDVPWYGQLMRKTALLAYLYQIDYWYKKYNIRIED